MVTISKNLRRVFHWHETFVQINCKWNSCYTRQRSSLYCYRRRLKTKDYPSCRKFENGYLRKKAVGDIVSKPQPQIQAAPEVRGIIWENLLSLKVTNGSTSPFSFLLKAESWSHMLKSLRRLLAQKARFCTVTKSVWTLFFWIILSCPVQLILFSIHILNPTLEKFHF